MTAPSRRRRHHKVQTDLPPELVAQVNRLLAQPGVSYREITDFLRERGHEISKSSLHRYGQEFLNRMERLQVIREQAAAIVQGSGDRPATELAEAGSQLSLQLIIEHLMTVENLQGAKPTELIKALALLQRSDVAREKLKLEFRQKAEKAVEQIESRAREKGLDPETLRFIKEQVYGIIQSG